MNLTKYVVLRAAPDLPPGILDPEFEGQWCEREDFLIRPTDTMVRLAGRVVFVAVATGRFERDPARRPGDDVAEVFEVRP